MHVSYKDRMSCIDDFTHIDEQFLLFAVAKISKGIYLTLRVASVIEGLYFHLSAGASGCLLRK